MSQLIEKLSIYCNYIVYYRIFDIPFIVLWLGCAAIFFSIRLGFPNVLLLKKSIQVLTGKDDKKEDPTSPFKVMISSAAATIGLGNIAGVAISIKIGGSGVLFWIVIFIFLSMSLKCSEIIAGHKYRVITPNGFNGGPFYYIKFIFEKFNLNRIGGFLSFMFTIIMLITPIGLSSFQMNQVVSILTNGLIYHDEILNIHNHQVLYISIAMSLIVTYILLGGIKTIGLIASKLVPSMVLVYIAICSIVIIKNIHNLPDVLRDIFSNALNFESFATSGIFMVIIQGMKRALFITEAGTGTSPIIHSNSSIKSSAKQGITIFVEGYFILIGVILTGLVVLITKIDIYSSNLSGIMLIKMSISSVHSYLGSALMVCAFLFGFTTIMTNGYYSTKSWEFLSHNKYSKLPLIIYGLCIFYGGVSHANHIINIADTLFLLATIPNILALYLMSNQIAKELKTIK